MMLRESNAEALAKIFQAQKDGKLFKNGSPVERDELLDPNGVYEINDKEYTCYNSGVDSVHQFQLENMALKIFEDDNSKKDEEFYVEWSVQGEDEDYEIKRIASAKDAFNAADAFFSKLRRDIGTMESAIERQKARGFNQTGLKLKDMSSEDFVRAFLAMRDSKLMVLTDNGWRPVAKSGFLNYDCVYKIV